MHSSDPFGGPPAAGASNGFYTNPVNVNGGQAPFRPSPQLQRQPTPPYHVQMGSDGFSNNSGANHGDGGFYNFNSAPQGNNGGGYFGNDQRQNDLAPAASGEVHRTRFGYIEDDLPLLEELGIFPRHIQAKALAVLNPLGKIAPEAIEDMDLAGPVMFAVILGFLLSLQGKVQFGAIYGLSLLGIAFAKMLLTLMCDQHEVAVQFVVSTLGYCLLPNLVLAVVQTFQHWLVGSHTVILPIAFVVIGWSSWCATTMFVQALTMQSQRFLILYPCFLFYAVFAALTIF